MGEARRPLADRFWEKVDKTAPAPSHVPSVGNCWVWTGAPRGGRYGIFMITRGKFASAHRVAFEIEHGPIPDERLVCHRCDNGRCVRPSHLFLGTAKDNAGDMVAKGRSVVGTKRPGTGPAGERNGRARLTATQVEEIRHRRVTERLTIREIAKAYDISKSQAQNIVSGAQWGLS